MRSIPVTLADSNVLVGHINGTVAVITVTSRNFLAIGRGYSVDARVLEEIEIRGCDTIEFHNTRSRKRQRISIASFRANARSFNFGYGQKLVAPETLYETVQEAR